MISKPWEPGEPGKAYMRPKRKVSCTLAIDAVYFQ